VLEVDDGPELAVHVENDAVPDIAGGGHAGTTFTTGEGVASRKAAIARPSMLRGQPAERPMA
jgi:hypothetical protein